MTAKGKTMAELSPGDATRHGRIRVGMISLGCAKNLVDAEIMLGGVRAHGMEIPRSAEEADVMIVNSCGFIDAAKEESIEAILSANEQGLSRKGGRQRVIVSASLSQRFD